jgi:hypothetical protein
MLLPWGAPFLPGAGARHGDGGPVCPPRPGPPLFLLNLSVTLSLRINNFSSQPFVTIGGGALPLPLPMPAQPATLTATRVATKAMSTFFIGSPFFTPRDAHLVPRYPVGRPPALNAFTASGDSRPLRRRLCPWGHSRPRGKAVSSGHRSVSRRSPPGQRSPKNRSSPGECATGAAWRSSPTMSDIASDPSTLSRKNPTIEGSEASNTQATLMSQLGHLWSKVSAHSLGLRYHPKVLPCCKYCVLRFCAPQRYRGAFFRLNTK